MPFPLDHPRPAPFALGASASTGILLCHGFTGTPQEVWPLGRGLAELGYRVVGPLLRGHGTNADDLQKTSGKDVIEQVRLEAESSRAEVLVGFSMGALLSLIVASGRPRIRALVLVASALKLKGLSGVFVQALRVPGIAHLPFAIRRGGGKPYIPPPNSPLETSDPDEAAAARVALQATPLLGDHFHYDRLPLRWAHELRLLQDQAREAARRLTCPVLIVHGDEDASADPSGSEDLARIIGARATLRRFPASGHVVPMGPDRGVLAAEVVRFLRAHGIQAGS